MLEFFDVFKLIISNSVACLLPMIMV